MGSPTFDKVSEKLNQMSLLVQVGRCISAVNVFLPQGEELYVDLSFDSDLSVCTQSVRRKNIKWS